jgi:hypothetical protein
MGYQQASYFYYYDTITVVDPQTLIDNGIADQ